VGGSTTGLSANGAGYNAGDVIDMGLGRSNSELFFLAAHIKKGDQELWFTPMRARGGTPICR
jgi:hypothetical protein